MTFYINPKLLLILYGNQRHLTTRSFLQVAHCSEHIFRRKMIVSQKRNNHKTLKCFFCQHYQVTVNSGYLL